MTLPYLFSDDIGPEEVAILAEAIGRAIDELDEKELEAALAGGGAPDTGSETDSAPDGGREATGPEAGSALDGGDPLATGNGVQAAPAGEDRPPYENKRGSGPPAEAASS
jgi:hypothetical protein